MGTVPIFRGVRFLLIASALLGACRQEAPPPPADLQRPVRVETLAPGEFKPSITLLGVVAAGSSIPVVVPSTGVVSYPGRAGGALRTGEAVKAGEALALLEDESARLAVAEGELEAERMRVETQRMRRSHDEGVVEESRLQDAESRLLLAEERLKSARTRAATLTLRAPGDGTLSVESPVAAGSLVQSGQVLARVVSAGALRVEATAAAADRAAVAIGLPARLSATGHEDGTGRVSEIAPEVDSAGTARVVIDVVTWDDPPVPGEGVTAEIELPARIDALTIPVSALTVSGGGAGAFVVERSAAFEGAAHRARRQAVTTGRRRGDRVEVLGGLKDGDRVVVSGADVLADGDGVAVEEPAAAK